MTEEFNEEDDFDLGIPDLPIEDFEIPEDEDIGLESTHGGSIEIAFLGGGQGGSRLVEAFYKLGYKKALVVNTAKHDLHHIQLPENQKVHLGGDLKGAGKNMEAGRLAAESCDQDIYNLMLRTFGKVDRIFVAVGAGGGSGGGSCKVLIDLAQRYLRYIGHVDAERRTGVLIALPTSGECASPRVAQNAKNLVTDLCTMAEVGQIAPLLIVDNDKIKKLYPRMTVKQFWPTVNDTVAGLFHTLNVITIKNSEYTSFDPADFDSLLSLSGCMLLGVTTVRDVSSHTSISKALKDNLGKTLLAGGFDLSTAKGVATIVVGGRDLFAEVEGLMDAIEFGFDTTANIVGDALVHRGIYESGKGKLRVYTVVAGLDRPEKRLEELSRLLKK